jgi:hypothetical protein
LGCLPNAVRDAQALCDKVNALPRCRAKLLADVPDRISIREGIRNFLIEPGLQKDPPDTVLVNYSGHGIQKGGTVYMLPGGANPGDSKCEPDVEFLSIRDMFKWCREDLDLLARDLDPPRQVTFVLVVDACRVAEMDQATLSSSLEPPPGSAPKKWALCFSCSRDSTASDGPQGAHSPFAQELLDEKAGIFAAGVPLKGGLEEACRRMREQHRGQDPMPVGLHSIKEDWCFYPSPGATYSADNGGATAGAGEAEEREVGKPARDGAHSTLSSNLVQLLKEWDIEDAADALERDGWTSLKKMQLMDDTDVDAMKLRRATEKVLKAKLCTLALVPSKAEQEENEKNEKNEKLPQTATATAVVVQVVTTAGAAEAMAPVAAGGDEELARRLQEQEEQALEESRRQQQAEDARLAQALEFDELEPTGSQGSQVVPRGTSTSGMLISPAASSTEAAAASPAPAVASAKHSEAKDIKLQVKSALSIGFTRFSSMSCFGHFALGLFHVLTLSSTSSPAGTSDVQSKQHLFH